MQKEKFGRRWKMVWLVVVLLLVAACTAGPATEPVMDSAERAEETAVEAETESGDEAVPTEVPVEEMEGETAVEPETDQLSDQTPTYVIESQGAQAIDVEILTGDDRSDRLASLTSSWNTNWELRTIELDDVLSGGPPRDGIPSIDTPTFISIAEAEAWLADNEPVIVMDINGDARAYPLQIMTWHEIVNDTIGDIPVVVTFCPLCNSAIAFERVVDGEPVEFGVSGLLRNSDLIMYDRTDESLWQQFTGEAIVGNHVGKQLRFLPSRLVSFADFKDAFPEGVVLSRNTGFSRSYGQNPYAGYDTIGSNPFLFTGELDGRLPAVARVVTVSLDEVDIAYPVDLLAETGVIADEQAGQPLVVFHIPGTASALGARVIAEAEDVGATGVFDPVVEGQQLTFERQENRFVDNETGSTWNILGQAIEGELTGTQLQPIVSGDHFWFSWAAFRPDTILYQP